MSRCEEIRPDLAGYALGGLDDAEVAAVEEHTADCAVCARELADLRDSAALLAVAGRQAPPPVPEHVREQVLASAVRSHRRRRTVLAVAAAIVVVAVALGAGVLGYLDRGQPTDVAVPLESVEPYEASGEVAFREDGGTLTVQIDVDGLEPLDDPAVYEAWLYTEEGSVVSLERVEGVDDGVAELEATIDGPMERFKRFWITAEPDRDESEHQGPTVVYAPVPHLR
ncbi:MAG: anti-sigma factor family protein [Actinomycetota bacterium]